jgi:hypothetical protein
VFTFIKGQAGGTDLVQGFNSSDKIALDGYGGGAVNDALKSQTMSAGSVTITLDDHTKVTFADVSSLTKSNFT